MIFVDKTSDQYVSKGEKWVTKLIQLSVYLSHAGLRSKAMKKLIKTFSVVLVVAAVLMLLPSPGYSFRGGGSPGYHGGYGFRGGPWWGAAAWPYSWGAWGYPYYGYPYYAGYPYYGYSYYSGYRRVVVKRQPQATPPQPAPAHKQDRN